MPHAIIALAIVLGLWFPPHFDTTTTPATLAASAPIIVTDDLGHWWIDGQWYSADGSPYLPDGLGHFWKNGVWLNADGSVWTPAPDPTAIPWFVPARFHAAYLQCLANPERFDAAMWSSIVDWPQTEAAYVRSREGGDDLCQFNTAGSGACGPYQLLPCADAYLTWPGQIAAAHAKYVDGGRSFARHWYQWWGR